MGQTLGTLYFSLFWGFDPPPLLCLAKPLLFWGLLEWGWTILEFLLRGGGGCGGVVDFSWNGGESDLDGVVKAIKRVGVVKR